MVRRDRNFAKLAAIFQKLLKRGPRKKIFSDIGPAVHRHLLFAEPGPTRKQVRRSKLP